MRIAMWSGPRNLSTAMMRSFGNRPDTFVTDEPFYSHYLKKTQLPHPGAEEVICTHESDWLKVVDWLTGPIPEGKTHWYQKHMAHHLLPGMDCDWMNNLHHAFLIRDPDDVVASLTEFISYPTLRDTGFPQQESLFEMQRKRIGRNPPVIDSRDLQSNPASVLGQLCDNLGIAYTDVMLSWKPGIHPTDGCWAKHWYAKVAKTTGFAPPRDSTSSVPEELKPILEDCREIYHRLHRHRIIP
jgi:Sulfotransferase domain